MAFCIRNFHNELVSCPNREARADVVSQIDQFLHTTHDRVVYLPVLARDDDAFGPKRESRASARSLDPHIQGTNGAAAIQVHLTMISLDSIDFTAEPVVLTDKLGDEGILRLFVKRAGACKLLNYTIIKTAIRLDMVKASD